MVLLLACAPAPMDTPGSTPVDTCPEVAPPADKVPGSEAWPARELAGSITWELTFNTAGHLLGYQDCSYTREYAAFGETRDLGWLCPDCDVLLQDTAVMTAGYADCYTQISESEADRVEQLGLRGDTFYRSGTANVTLAEVATIEGNWDDFAVAWEDTSTIDLPVRATLSARGRLALTETAELLEDPQSPREELYACGWPLDNPGGENGSYTLADGEVFPNFRLEDQCGEPFSLWDLRGRWIVLDASSPDCGPCQVMAESAPAFEAEMEADCLHVETVTLLNEKLRAINEPADQTARVEWAEYFGLTGPVVGDEGFGYATLPPYLGEEGGMSLPSWVVIAPDGRLAGGGSGFSEEDGGWAEIAEMIRE